MKAAWLITLAPLAGCDTVPTAEQFIPDYRGVETMLLADDLVQFNVSMTNALSAQDVKNYAECAAAGYTLIRGWGFARHLRTNVDEEAGVWTADAVYTISPALPRGISTIDAEVVSAACVEKGIPTV
ncbi:MAG: hypothetical protein AAFO97_18135 [Pseudomonadota bacterium]